MKTWRVECNNGDGWFIIAGDLFEHNARYHADRYRQMWPDSEIRVTRRATPRHCNDGNASSGEGKHPASIYRQSL